MIPERTRRPSGPSEIDVLKEGVNFLVEAWLATHEGREARAYLKMLARLISEENPRSLVGITELDPNSLEGLEVRRWLRERLSVWVARYGA